jgi:hypothetical protein
MTKNCKMRDALNVILIGVSAALLVHSYWTPISDPVNLTKMMTYKTRSINGQPAAVTMSGGCYLGKDAVKCSALQLGKGIL